MNLYPLCIFGPEFFARFKKISLLLREIRISVLSFSLCLLLQCTKGCEAWEQALDTSCQAVCVSIAATFIFMTFIIGETYVNLHYARNAVLRTAVLRNIFPILMR